jgi:hypothetical protein
MIDKKRLHEYETSKGPWSREAQEEIVAALREAWRERDEALSRTVDACEDEKR